MTGDDGWEGVGYAPAELRAAQTYERLKSAILSGRLGSGIALVETQIAAELGVSRTPVREALTRLRHDGLVERRERQLVVRRRSAEEILDIYDARIILEAGAARRAAGRRTETDLVLMLQSIEMGERITSGIPSELARLNVEFHRTVWSATHNDTLIDLLGRLSLHLGRYPETTLSFPGRWESACGEHRDLMRAIEDRDEDRAAAIAEQHFRAARDIRLKLQASELG